MPGSNRGNNDHCLIDLKSRRQHTQTLLISCSDCQLDTSLITSIHPGEFYLIQNMGNFIPPYHPSLNYSESAGIEFALTYLPIADIIICGHRHCAAMKACQQHTNNIENTNIQLERWISHMRSQIPFHDSAHIDEIVCRHILNQIENIKKYPLVRDKLENHSLTIHAWYYDAENKSMHRWDSKSRLFHAIKQTEGLTE